MILRARLKNVPAFLSLLFGAFVLRLPLEEYEKVSSTRRSLSNNQGLNVLFARSLRLKRINVPYISKQLVGSKP